MISDFRDRPYRCFVLSLSIAAVLLLAALAGNADADDCCCAHCGCNAPCQKVCRLVCEEKKVEVFCYGCKCEEFCLPCHSKPLCKNCETVCDDCADENWDPAGPHAKPKRFVWRDWLPSTTAKTYTRTKLMRKSEFVKVPSYKWVVEDLCAQCAAARAPENVLPVVSATDPALQVADKP